VNNLISLDEYIRNPCSSLSIPYWKSKIVKLPDGMKIVHDNDFSIKYLEKYIDEKYFRLYHNLENISRIELTEFSIITAEYKDIDIIVSVINESYPDIKADYAQFYEYTQTPVYNADLWILVIEKVTGKCVGSGIADYDKEVKELVLEWIQVLPDYRGRKIGQVIVNELLYRMQNIAKFASVSGQIDNATKPEMLYRKCGFVGNDIWHILRII
jgi:GNAT superfamily N-acetyltransferase